MASRYTAETQPYKTPSDSDAHAASENALNVDAQDDVGPAGDDKSALKTGSKASYTPNSAINEHSYGKDGGKPNAISGVPSVQVGGSFEVGVVPAMPGQLKIGENKNVSEII